MSINGKVFFIQTYNTDDNNGHKKSAFEIAFSEVLDIVTKVPPLLLLLSHHIPTIFHPKDQYPQIWFQIAASTSQMQVNPI